MSEGLNSGRRHWTALLRPARRCCHRRRFSAKLVTGSGRLQRSWQTGALGCPDLGNLFLPVPTWFSKDEVYPAVLKTLPGG
jgi:hypothetical protein